MLLDFFFKAAFEIFKYLNDCSSIRLDFLFEELNWQS